MWFIDFGKFSKALGFCEPVPLHDLARAVGLSERVTVLTVASVHKGQRKEYGWVSVSSSGRSNLMNSHLIKLNITKIIFIYIIKL